MLRRIVLPILLGLFALAACPGYALRPDILYLGSGKFVQVSPPRQLTLNAHLTQFAFEPLGLEVAAAGSETVEKTTTYFVKTIATRRGAEMSRLSFSLTAPAEDIYGFEIVGWASSGRSLIVKKTDQNAEKGVTVEYLRWNLATDPPTATRIALQSLLPEGASDGGAEVNASPGGRWIVIKEYFSVPAAPASAEVFGVQTSLYDVEKDTLRPLSLPTGYFGLGWIDSSRFRYRDSDKNWKSYEVLTGKIAESTASPPSAFAEKPAVSRRYPDLKLTVEAQVLTDRESGSGQTPAQILWIRRTSSEKMPLRTASAGLVAGEIAPQAAWSPKGDQIAFLAGGDLWVTEIGPVPPAQPLAREKLVLGLPLTCAEEKELAMSGLKQIGLGIAQYTQDNDEHYPSADGFEDKIYPYLKTREVFQFGASHFAYHPPPDLSLASLEAPAETVIGTMDLPCGRIALFADGHVKSITLPGTP